MTTGMDRVVYSVLVLIAVFSAANGQCTIPQRIRGTWEVLDSTRLKVDFNVTFTSSSLVGVTFWDKTLFYDCYLRSGNYYVFSSEKTSLFDLYDVNIYFCWYLSAFSSTTYRIYELTNKVLYSVEERAKAYLNTTVPSVNDVCEVSFGTALSYKQMQVPFNP